MKTVPPHPRRSGMLDSTPARRARNTPSNIVSLANMRLLIKYIISILLKDKKLKKLISLKDQRYSYTQVMSQASATFFLSSF